MSAYAGRFAPLVAYVTTQDARELDLSFDAISTILGDELPLLARVNTDLWTSRQYPHVRRWEAHGWQARLDRMRHVVRFSRKESS